MNTERNTLQITGGPSRDRLLDAFKYAYERSAPTTTFKVVVGYTKDLELHGDVKNITITAIQHEDDSGESFNLQGNCSLPEATCKASGIQTDRRLRFKAYYNAKSRTGWLAFTK